MYMFDQNWPIVALIVAPVVAPIVPPIQIKHVHSSVSYQQSIYQRYDYKKWVQAGKHIFKTRVKILLLDKKI